MPQTNDHDISFDEFDGAFPHPSRRFGGAAGGGPFRPRTTAGGADQSASIGGPSMLVDSRPSTPRGTSPARVTR